METYQTLTYILAVQKLYISKHAKEYLTIPLNLLDLAGEHFQPVELHEPKGENSTEDGPSLLGEELLINLGARPDQGEHLPVDVHRGDVRHVDLEEWAGGGGGQW